MSEQQYTEADVLIAHTRWLTEMQEMVQETVQGVALRGARPVPIGVTNGATRRPTTSAGALVGFALENVSADEEASVQVLFHDGADDNADVILPITLAPGESTRDWFGPGGISLFEGLFVNISGGDVRGCVYLRGVE